MSKMRRQIARPGAGALLGICLILGGSVFSPARTAQAPTSLWFDPTQLPSFTGTVDRYVPNPDGRVDRLIFKQGPQIAFPPDAFAAVLRVAPPGKPLVVWGIRARNAPIITMLAFAAPDSEASILDRFYWRPERGQAADRREMMLIGTVWVPYLAPQGLIAGAILENGDVIHVDPPIAEAFKERFKDGAKIVAVGRGADTPYGKSIEAVRLGDSVATLEPVAERVPPAAAPVPQAGNSRPAE
jgi:hypothetical protein